MSEPDPKVTKAILAMKASLGAFLKDGHALLTEQKKEVAAFAKEAAAAEKKFDAENDKIIDEVNKVYAKMNSDIAALVKDYMDIVKKTDGLTSVRPTVAKALDRFSLTFDEKCVAEAQSTLKKHRDEVLKAGDKKDKTMATFVKAMDGLIAKVG